MPKILIVEDELEIRRGIALSLAREGHEVFETDRGEAALDLVWAKKPDLMLLDVALPGINGFEVCRRLRLAGSDVVVIFLTARADEIDRVVGLEIGADDYVVKPFSIRELQARIQVRLRGHSKSAKVSRYQFGDVEINFETLQAKRKGKPLDLTQREFEILRYFVAHRGEVVTRDQFLTAVWKQEGKTETRTVDTHIQKLRKKIELDPDRPEFLITSYGEGYKFVG